MRVVVVGAGLGGLRTAEALRAKGFDGELVLVGDETHLPYDRPPLSKHVLRGEREPMLLRPEEAYAELSLDLRLGVAATGLDVGGRRVLTGHGPVPFDHVVVATGAVPRRLPGAPGHVLRTLDDARALAPVLEAGRVIGVVGAGLIGCEVAASARTKGADVHVVDLLPKPLVRVLGTEVAERVQALHEERGVVFHLGTTVVHAAPHRLELGDGTVLEVDALLEAMGIVPCTAWLADSGLDLDDGMVCDLVGEAAPGVWAVGDVARWGGTRHEHWTSAVEQAAVVADAILGDRRERTDPPYWWSDQYDVKLQGLGRIEPGDEVVVVEAGSRRRPLALYSRDGRLSGVVGFSNAAAVFALKERIGDPWDEVRATLG
ncbi:MAG TPA: FAD-dependent oxidoreductase [Mycobacteriales bacterium]|nr:FAD-dependent oxidoreductase [Mycobacteriales bacterium]